jgi:hypothetical protein
MRKTVLMVLVFSLLALCFPIQAASAQNVWKVKNASGHTIGTLKRRGSHFNVYTPAKVLRGAVQPVPDLPWQWTAGMWLPGDGGVRRLATIFVGTKYVPWYTLSSDSEDSPIGRVLKRRGRWLVQWEVSRDFNSWRTRGSVAGSCKAWAALGAVFVLDDKWQ